MEILLNVIYYVIPFIVLLGILVFVHEFGHFIIARLLGAKVVVFSIGFGKELWGRVDKYGTRWKLSAVPLGGYCQFLGDADASSSTVDESLENLSEEDKKGAFSLLAAWKKLCIVVAGPLFNYLFALLLFIALFYSFGKIVYPSVVGKVMPGEAADIAGIMEGDRILSLNGNPTPDFQALSNEVSLAETDDVMIELERPTTVHIQARETEFNQNNVAKTEKIIGLVFDADNIEKKTEAPQSGIKVKNVVMNSAAEEAGFQVGDVIEKINDVEIGNVVDFIEFVRAHIDEELEITYARPMSVAVTLKDTDFEQEDGRKVKRRMLGVQSSFKVDFMHHMDLCEAIKAGYDEVSDLTITTLRGLGQMITGKRGGKDVGGIIRIAEMSGDISKAGGLISFIYFMGLLSVNLGLINLLPIPVLDGGSIIIFLVEMIIGKDLQPKIKESIFKIGMFIILVIMLLATWNDITHLISRWFD
ncbi:MAG: RIP metalloprotease RseP [Alphaproteobacteria bacterium]|nr:RIP metalloprotease RseP [Alphaproteobacteria bacterium]